MTEADRVDLLIEIAGWPSDDPQWRFHALYVVRALRGEPYPLPDEF